MKRVLFALLLHAFLYGSAQSNLVPNYSFEDSIKCDKDPNQFNGYIKDWIAVNGIGGGGYVCWYSGNCWTAGYVGVPHNEFGFQNPRTGKSYSGIVNYVSPYNAGPITSDYRNYVQCLLKTPLKSGISYCVTFYVNLGDTCSWACNDIGAYFSDSALVNDTTAKVKSYLNPQIANDPIANPLTDKVNWTRVSGNFIAAGGEKYIVIGNFKDDANSSIDSVPGGNPSNHYDCQAAYYFIDDVFVRAIVLSRAGNDTTICQGAQVLIGKDTALPGVTYQWQPATGLSSPNNAQTLASPTITTTYTLTVYNDSNKGCNCPDSINSSTITVKVDDFSIIACCQVTTSQWQSVNINTSVAKNYIWSPSLGLNCDTCQNVTANPQATTMYYVTETDSLGCHATDSILITVKDQDNFFVPTAFSPNDDGVNDILLVKGNNIATLHITIYDRWGNKVFESESQSEGWDGNYGGKTEDAGTFVYYARGTYTDGTTFNKKGNVTLVR
jgi:gliding motility-associated-like protein